MAAQQVKGKKLLGPYSADTFIMVQNAKSVLFFQEKKSILKELVILL